MVQPDLYTDLNMCAPIGALYIELIRAGYKIKQSHDAHLFKQCCDERDGRVISPQSDAIYFDFTEGNCFYLLAYTDQDELVGTLAVRNDVLGRTCLADLFVKQYPRVFEGKQSGQFAPPAYEISGNVAYHGDFWVKKSHASKGLTFLLPRLALILTMTKFGSDYAYSLIRPRIINTRFHNKAGFVSTSDFAIGWEDPPQNLGPDLALVYSKASDIRWLAFNEFSRIHEQFAM